MFVSADGTPRDGVKPLLVKMKKYVIRVPSIKTIINVVLKASAKLNYYCLLLLFSLYLLVFVN